MKQSLIFGIILAALIGGYVYDKRLTRKETIWLMDSLYSAKKRIINFDSIKAEIQWEDLKKIDSIGKGEFKFTRTSQNELVAKLDSILTRLRTPDESPR